MEIGNFATTLKKCERCGRTGTKNFILCNSCYLDVCDNLKRIELKAKGIEVILPSDVRPLGNSGYIPFPKKFVGRNVKVLILEEPSFGLLSKKTKGGKE